MKFVLEVEMASYHEQSLAQTAADIQGHLARTEHTILDIVSYTNCYPLEES